MTRLRSEDVAALALDLQAYDAELRRKVGTDLRGLACGAAGMDEATFERAAVATTVAVVPITIGKGIIPGFADAVKRILTHIGLPVLVTDQPDVSGLEEAYRRRRSLIFLADDNRFVVIHTRHGRVVSNSDATGVGYAWGLNEMAGGVEGKPVLVIGCGRVGRSAVARLLGFGATVHVQDAIPARARQFATEFPTSRVEENLQDALMRHRLILDACPGAGIIDAPAVGAETFVSAPGVPIGLTAEALMKTSGRVLHDFLEIGVATMATMVVASDK